MCANSASSTVFAIHPSPGMLGSMNTKSQQLSREAIDEFKIIYQEEFGDVLSDNEVQEIAIRLLRFFGILTKSYPDSVDASNLPG